MNKTEALELSTELVILTAARYNLRRTLLHFIKDNKDQIQDEWFQKKAERGYLRDLTDDEIDTAIRAIVGRL